MSDQLLGEMISDGLLEENKRGVFLSHQMTFELLVWLRQVEDRPVPDRLTPYLHNRDALLTLFMLVGTEWATALDEIAKREIRMSRAKVKNEPTA